MYDEAAQLVQGYGLAACPLHVADRAAFRHAATEGKTVMEIEPNGKAADEVRQLYKWACKHVNMPTFRKRRASA
jgi:chromosome partitioning protein